MFVLFNYNAVLLLRCFFQVPYFTHLGSVIILILVPFFLLQE